MKVSLSWLKELVDFNLTPQQLADQLSLKSIGVKQVTNDFIELDLTYNRGDLLSLRGAAYEVAAITGSKIKFKDQKFAWEDQNLPQAKVQIENEGLAPIYCIAKIENLKVKHSDDSWVKKLSEAGIRSINNLADITNLMMIEYGQPMHAFDGKKVQNETIVVRTAQKGEELLTLDGKTRKLDPADLLIADSQKPLGLAGIMGGKDSEISDSTTTVLLEAAIFNPTSNRASSKRHGLYSDASKRFQHGLSPKRLLQALDAAIKMYQDLGGTLTAITLIGNFDKEERKLNLNIQKTNDLIGLTLSQETIISCLEKLNFEIKNVDEENLEATIPYFRLDIQIEEDLIEEVARMYGYEKIEGITLVNEEIPSIDQSLPKFIYDLKLKLKELGLTETQTYSFYSSTVLESIQSPKLDKNDLIKIANPISSETEYLRMDLWPNLVEAVGKNIKKGYKDMGIFEIGKIYFKNPEGKTGEKYTLSLALMNGSDNPLEELIAIIEKLDLEIELVESREASTLFHPKRILDIKKNEDRIGGAGEIHLKLLNQLEIEQRVAVIELNLEKLV